MFRLHLSRAVIVFYILILCTTFIHNIGIAQEENTFCADCQPLTTKEILEHFKSNARISDAIIKAENLVEAVKKSQKRG